MRKKSKPLIIFIALVSIFVGQAQLVSAKNPETQIANLEIQPSFESYPANIAHPRDTSQLVLTTRLAKKYKSVITAEAAKPVNFAGHYRVATWGCGTDCRGFAIINKHTGVVYTLPGVEYVAGVMGNEEERLAFKADSKLFIMTGIQNDKVEGKFYYIWGKEKLTLLAKHPIAKLDISASDVDGLATTK